MSSQLWKCCVSTIQAGLFYTESTWSTYSGRVVLGCKCISRVTGDRFTMCNIINKYKSTLTHKIYSANLLALENTLAFINLKLSTNKSVNNIYLVCQCTLIPNYNIVIFSKF